MRDKNIENILINYKLYIDTCSLMVNSNGFFELELIPILKQLNKKLYVISNVKNELEKLMNNPIKHDIAQRGLNNLNLLLTNQVIAMEKGHESVHADGAFFEILYNERRKNNICLITEDKKLALTVLTNLKYIECVDFNYDITTFKINNGNPLIWDTQNLEEKIGVVDLPAFQTMNQNHKSKLLISFMIDNSMTMKGERMDSLKMALTSLFNELSFGDLKDNISYEVVAFEDFNPKILKSFNDVDFKIDTLIAGKIPFVNKAVNECLNNLHEEQNKYTDISLYKPWLILLSDGQSFDDTSFVSSKINKLKSNNELLFIPFNLSVNNLSSKMEPLEKEKFFIKVGNNKFTSLSKWIMDLIVERLITPVDESIKIKKSSFDGWAILK